MKNILTFAEAHSVILFDIRGKHIHGYNDWQKYIKSNKFPIGVARQPQITYKHKGWISWGHWLGTGNISNIQKNKDFVSYDEAIKIIAKDIVKYKIKSRNDWYNDYVNPQYIPISVPTNPQITYKHKGWISWGHWLGTGNVVGGVRKYKVNHNFFKQWSNDMSYVLGFWFADGCMKDHKRFSIYQHIKDKYLLNSILNSMESNYPVHDDKRNCCYFEITSKTLCEDLKLQGGTIRKSKTLCFPEIPDNYLNDFIRGFFDGDGCITYDKRNRKYMSYITCASDKFLYQMQTVLRNNGIDCHKNNQIAIKFNADNTLKLGEFIYYDGVNKDLVMKRKYDKFVDAKLPPVLAE